jgi:hypothetical protein
VGHSYAAKEVCYNSAELSAEESILKVSAWIVGLIVVAMGAFIVVAAMFHSLRRRIELIYVVGRSEEQEIK